MTTLLNSLRRREKKKKKEENHSFTKKREKGFFHLVENLWALGIHQETKKRGKSTQNQKGQNWFCIKLYIIISFFLCKNYEIQICIFIKIIVQNLAKIFQCKQNCFTKIKLLYQKFPLCKISNSKVLSVDILISCIISQNHKRRQLLLNKLRLGSSLLRNSLIVPKQTVVCQASVLTHGIM